MNAFDQPDVQDSKARTKNKIADYQKTGKLADVDLVNGMDAKPALEEFLSGAQAGDFVAINAYLPRNEETTEALQAAGRRVLRIRLGGDFLRELSELAVTISA